MENIKKNIVTSGIVTAILAATTTVWAKEPQQTQIMNEYMTSQAAMEWMMLALWGLVLCILVLVVRWVSNLLNTETEKGRSQKTAMDILKNRFAAGEIDSGEFETRKRILLE